MSDLTIFLSKYLPSTVERKLRWFRDEYLRNYKIESLPQELWRNDQKYHSISLCITSMNRLYQLKETLEKNIKANEDYPNLEFVLLNYNSQDGLHEWVQENCMNYIKSGVLSYYHTTEPDHFHASKAKNLVHRLAKGEILCNLDGDNFTGDHFARYINYLYNKKGLDHLFHFHKPPLWGTTGRIVYSKENFMKIAGYDEALLPSGFEDWDVILRLKASGLVSETIQLDNFLHYISNSTDEKIITYTKKRKSIGETGDWFDMNDTNEKESHSNIEKGILVANSSSGSWGCGKVFKNFEKVASKID